MHNIDIGKILKLTTRKSRKVTLTFNPDLYHMFEEESKKERIKPTQNVQQLIIAYLTKKGRFKT